MEMKTMFDIETEVKKLTEAYCVEHNLPIRRQFTHEELEESIQRIREAAKTLETSDLSPHCHVSDAEEAEEEPEEEEDPRWDEDQYLDDPRHGQAAGLNRERG